MEFKTWRKQDADLATVSLNGNLAILQRFLRFCENIDAVPEGFADCVPMPIVPDGEEVNYEVPADAEIESIKSYCRQFERDSRYGSASATVLDSELPRAANTQSR